MENMTGALAAVGGRRITIMKKIPEYFGCKVFDDREMKANLSAKVYQSLRKTIDEGAKLDITVANSVAAAMKDCCSPRSNPLYPLVPAAYRHYGGKA